MINENNTISNIAELVDCISEYGWTPSLEQLFGKELRDNGIDTSSSDKDLIEALCKKCVSTEDFGFIIALIIYIGPAIALLIKNIFDRARRRKLERLMAVGYDDTNTKNYWTNADMRMAIYTASDFIKYADIVIDLAHLSYKLVDPPSSEEILLSGIRRSMKDIVRFRDDGRVDKILLPEPKSILIVEDGGWTLGRIQAAVDRMDRIADNYGETLKQIRDRIDEVKKENENKDVEDITTLSIEGRVLIKSATQMISNLYFKLDAQYALLINHYKNVMRYA